MKNSFKGFINNYGIYLFLLLYFLLNLLSLDSFPFVHSDEAWLASLSRSIMTEKSFSATEDFFVITERFPHAIKSLFHLIQIPFIKINYSIISVRILSLLFSSSVLYFYYRIIKENIKSAPIHFAALFVLAADIQFIYISRYARQEIIILAALTAVLYLLFNSVTTKHIIISSFITGLSIGIHPNSFFIFPAAVLLITTVSFKNKKSFQEQFRYIILYVLITALFAIFFILFSLYLDNDFFYNYLEFGSKHGVSDIFLIKLLKLKRFYFKMFNRIAGTYFLPDIRFQLIVFSVSAAGAFIFSIFSIKNMNKNAALFAFLTGINTALFFIGKYSPPSVSFIFPAAWIITIFFIDSLKISNKYKIIIISLFCLVNINNSYNEIKKWTAHSYTEYMGNITSAIDSDLSGNTNKSDHQNINDALIDDADNRLFACINTAFFTSYKQLAAYNDIENFTESGIGFRDYIYRNKIRYIIITDEFDIIYNERPLWNDLYGNLYPYYSDIKEFIKSDALLLKEFKNPVYPVRIVDYMKRENYSVQVYKVTKD